MINFSKPKHLFILSISYLVFIILFLNVVGLDVLFGVNRTIGFAYDFINVSLVFFTWTLLVCGIVYLLMWIFSLRVNAKISIIQYSLFFLMQFLIYYEYRKGYCEFTPLSGMIVLVLLLCNIGFAIYYKLSDKNKRLEH
jgi:hypothetical protein